MRAEYMDDGRTSVSHDRDGSSLRDQFRKSRVGIPQAEEEAEDNTPWTRDDIARERSMTVRGVYQVIFCGRTRLCIL